MSTKFFQFTIVLLLSGLGFLSCASSEDREFARQAAARIHSQIRDRNFAAIYDEAASGFKTVDRAEFVARMNALQSKLGPVKNLTEMAYQTGFDSRAGKTHALVFDVHYEGERVRETLVFVGGDDPKMQLWKLGIEPVK